MAKIKIIYEYIEKFMLGFWGLTCLDLLAITNLPFLRNVDERISAFFSVIGALYLLSILPFRIIRLNERRIMDKIERKIKEEELKSLQLKNKQNEENNK